SRMSHAALLHIGSRIMAVVLATLLAVSPLSSALANEALDLTSTARTAAAPDSLAGPVAIRNGGQRQLIGAGSPITAAQAVALSQILATGNQSLTLGANGNAVGG